MIDTSVAQEVVELIELDGLPEQPDERLELLRIMSTSTKAKLDECPECGRSLEGLDVLAHAQVHYPISIPERLMSAEAKAREAALYRAADAQPPRR